MILEIDHLNKQYSRDNAYVKAVDSVNFSMNPGEMLSIFGQSGSGKSTLLNMIVGILKPTSGSIILDGDNITLKNSKELALLRNKKIGYVMQGQNLLNNFTILDNICMPYYLSEKNSIEGNTITKLNYYLFHKEIEKNRKHQLKDIKEAYENKARNLLDMVGLQGVEHAYPYQLSGGEIRRVSIARALINSPKILIADEPTSNLDLENANRIRNIFRNISKEQVAVLVSTHDNDFTKFSDRIFYMNKGKLSRCFYINGLDKEAVNC